MRACARDSDARAPGRRDCRFLAPENAERRSFRKASRRQIDAPMRRNILPISSGTGTRAEREKMLVKYVKNVWYAAGFPSELEGDFLARTICGKPVLLYRMSSGTVVALEDRCPHRFVPLSMGRRIGDSIQCGYHGLAFGPSGQCLENPNHKDAAGRADICVASYPVIERYRTLWIWMGDPALADPETIPDFGFLDDPAFRAPTGYSHIKGNYQLVVDNLLDLSHVHYLHPGVHEGSDFASFRNEVKQEGDQVWSMLWRPHYHLSPARQKEWGLDAEDVEGQGHSRWILPSTVAIYTAFWKHGSSIENGVKVPSAHLLTPETEYTTHYLWATARNHDLDDDAYTARQVKAVKNIFETQDAPMIEAQQKAMGAGTDIIKARSAILEADAAGILARRLISRRLRAEGSADLATAAE